jgi:hypothetical protein
VPGLTEELSSIANGYVRISHKFTRTKRYV